MAGKVIDILDVIVPDQLGTDIARKWAEWNMLRQNKVTAWTEVRQYVYATDTTQTSNSKLPWKNKTTLPKLCQVRDNLYANYMTSMFPKRKWLIWEAGDADSNTTDKRDAIVAYMNYVIDQPVFKKEIAKLVLDYIDYGNAIATVDWEDNTQNLKDKTQVGYVGPVIRRLNPVDVLFNPIAPAFENTPKLTRTVITLGEVKEFLTRLSTGDDLAEKKALWEYLKNVRNHVHGFDGELATKDSYFQMDGFTSYHHYLQSDYCELITLQGDIYDKEKDVFYRNYVITVADRHKVIHCAPNPSYFGSPPIFHAGWRIRQDNLWAMGPLDNLVGMQYRIDHIENLKADVFDLVTFPPLKIKGYVEDFEWGPFERIYVGDNGDVTMMAPPFQVLEANSEIDKIEARMEELAGAPKEALGIRTPGEKTAYEVQRLENAASRVFVNKIVQFEELEERLLNAMLELARRKLTTTSIRVFDDELKFSTFMTLDADDITGYGTIKPVAAKHFAERAELVQNLNNFFSSPIGENQAVMVHFSGLKTAQLFEDVLDLQDYKLVSPYIALSEQADAQRLQHSLQTQVAMEAQTPSGLTPDDHDPDIIAAHNAQGAPSGQTPPPGMGQAPPTGPAQRPGRPTP